MTPSQQFGIERAHEAPRCQHIRLNGVLCGSPALRNRRFCYYHHRVRRPGVPDYHLPLLEDATSVQFGIVQVARALEDKAYDTKTSTLLLYALQLASSNLKQLAREQQEAVYMNGPSLADIFLERLGALPEDELGGTRKPSEPVSEAFNQRCDTA